MKIIFLIFLAYTPFLTEARAAVISCQMTWSGCGIARAPFTCRLTPSSPLIEFCAHENFSGAIVPHVVLPPIQNPHSNPENCCVGSCWSTGCCPGMPKCTDPSN